jgi:hypothetical protein
LCSDTAAGWRCATKRGSGYTNEAAPQPDSTCASLDVRISSQNCKKSSLHSSSDFVRSLSHTLHGVMRARRPAFRRGVPPREAALEARVPPADRSRRCFLAGRTRLPARALRDETLPGSRSARGSGGRAAAPRLKGSRPRRDPFAPARTAPRRRDRVAPPRSKRKCCPLAGAQMVSSAAGRDSKILSVAIGEVVRIPVETDLR